MKSDEVSYTVAFAEGGYITLDIDADMKKLDDHDRAFVAVLIKMVNERMMKTVGV